MTILKSKDVLKRHDDGSTTVERHAIVDGRGRVIVADVVDDAWRQRLLDAFNEHETNDHANDTVDALVQAEAFVRGFEGDDLQEGIPDLLAGLRAAIVREQSRPDLLAALKGFVPACGGNPPGWLHEEFAAAENAVTKAEGRANG